jgi:hypothetical protein
MKMSTWLTEEQHVRILKLKAFPTMVSLVALLERSAL